MSDANISDEGQDGQEYEVLLKAADILAREFEDSKLLVEIERDKLQDENKRLRESLSDCLTLLKSCSFDETEVTERARKLLNL